MEEVSSKYIKMISNDPITSEVLCIFPDWSQNALSSWDVCARRHFYVCNRPQSPATARNHPQPFAMRLLWPWVWRVFQTSRNVVRFVRQAWHFVTSQYDPICLTTCHKSFCVTSAILLILRRFQKMTCILRASRSTLETSIVMLLGSCILQKDVSCCAFFCEAHCQAWVKWWQGENCMGGVGGESVICVASAAFGDHPSCVECPFCMASAAFGTLNTLHCTLRTLHSPLYTLRFTHSTLCTWCLTLHTLHFRLHTLHSNNAWHLTLQTPTLHTPLHLALNTLHFTLYILNSKFHTLHSPLYTLHSTLYTLHLTLYTSHSTRYPPHFTLHTLHFTLHTLLFAPHFTLNTPHSPLDTCIYGFQHLWVPTSMRFFRPYIYP